MGISGGSTSERAPAEAGVAVLGAGPAGLTAAHVLAGRGVEATVFEADQSVGGIAKTIELNGYRFDLGGHRFYTKIPQIQQFWESMLGEEWLLRKRMSRIYHRGRFFNYPLKAEDVFRGLGVVESARAAGSYLRWRRRMRHHEPTNFEEWVVGSFGRHIFRTFFESYTEKVWGIPASEIQSEWAAQRIQNFTLSKALLGVLGIQRGGAPTMIEEFHYPRLGPGQLWETLADRVEDSGIPVCRGNRVTAIHHSDGRVDAVTSEVEARERTHAVDGMISSVPLADLIEILDPPAPAEVIAAARRLRYRNLCLVALMTDEPEPFPDNWIYLHDPDTKAGRVQNFGAWSPDMVKPGTTCLGVEYFCFDDDPIWTMSEREATEMATAELSRIGLLDPDRVFDGVKVNVPKAYPMYDPDYREAVAEIRGYLEHLENFRTCGRNGLHRYNNQDHSMWTAILACRTLLDGEQHDLWSVSHKGEYLEQRGEVEADLHDLERV